MKVLPILKDLLLGLVLKVSWQVVAERCLTRIMVFCLTKLETYSSNTVTKGLVSDILSSLQGKKLKVIEELHERTSNK